MSGSGFRLIGVRFEIAGTKYCVAGVEGELNRCVLFVHHPDGTNDSFLEVWIPDLGLSFPYGFEVEPD